jgi:hypothetical protein
MLRFRLHPTPSGLFLGIAMIAFWALMWLWFLYSIGEGRDAQQRAWASAAMAATEPSVPPTERGSPTA